MSKLYIRKRQDITYTNPAILQGAGVSELTQASGSLIDGEFIVNKAETIELAANYATNTPFTVGVHKTAMMNIGLKLNKSGARKIPAQTWRIGTGNKNNQSDIYVNMVCLYVWRPGTGLIGKIFDNTAGSGVSGFGPPSGNAGLRYYQSVWEFAGAEVVNIEPATDILFLECWANYTKTGTSPDYPMYWASNLSGSKPFSEVMDTPGVAVIGRPDFDYQLLWEGGVSAYLNAGLTDFSGGAIDTVGVNVDVGTEVPASSDGIGIQLSEGTTFPVWITPVYQAVNIHESNWGNDEEGDPILIRNAQEKFVFGRRVKKFRFMTAGKYVIDTIYGTPFTP